MALVLSKPLSIEAVRSRHQKESNLLENPLKSGSIKDDDDDKAKYVMFEAKIDPDNQSDDAHIYRSKECQVWRRRSIVGRLLQTLQTI